MKSFCRRGKEWGCTGKWEVRRGCREGQCWQNWMKTSSPGREIDLAPLPRMQWDMCGFPGATVKLLRGRIGFCRICSLMLFPAVMLLRFRSSNLGFLIEQHWLRKAWERHGASGTLEAFSFLLGPIFSCDWGPLNLNEMCLCHYHYWLWIAHLLCMSSQAPPRSPWVQGF